MNYPEFHEDTVRREMHDAEMTGMWETLLDLGVPEALIDLAVKREGYDAETFQKLLVTHTSYTSFEQAYATVYEAA